VYVVRDNDPAGDGAMAGLFDRARTAWIDAIALSPHGDDFNDDLRRFGIDTLRTALRVQLAPEDVARFMLL
jgi:Toprim domain